MKHWLFEKIALAHARLSAATGLGGQAFRPAPHPADLFGARRPPLPSTQGDFPKEQHVDETAEFADLLSSLGSTHEPPNADAALRLKDIELEELRRNLKELRAMGDGLAELQKSHLAERAAFEAERDAALAETRLWEDWGAALERAQAASTKQIAVEGPVLDDETAALAKRYEALRGRHRRLTQRWRAVEGTERGAAIELVEARAELAEETQRAARLETQVAKLERDVQRRDAAHEREREKLANEKERTAAARAKAKEHRERSVARGRELRELTETLKDRDRRLTDLAGQWEALSAELATLTAAIESSDEPSGALLELLDRISRGDSAAA